MKTLILLRHAKSEHPEGVADRDRGLTGRGRRDASRAGEVLAERSLTPDTVLTSTARRAQRTAERVIAAAGFDGVLIGTRELYEADPGTILEVVRSLPADANCALLIGHNPGFREFVAQFAPQLESFPTAAWTQLEFDVPAWADITDRTPARLAGFWTPKSDRAGDDSSAANH